MSKHSKTDDPQLDYDTTAADSDYDLKDRKTRKEILKAARYDDARARHSQTDPFADRSNVKWFLAVISLVTLSVVLLAILIVHNNLFTAIIAVTLTAVNLVILWLTFKRNQAADNLAEAAQEYMLAGNDFIKQANEISVVSIKRMDDAIANLDKADEALAECRRLSGDDDRSKVWIPAGDCTIKHEFGEEGWRPTLDGHEHLLAAGPQDGDG